MISTQNNDRSNFIGGSEANLIYMNFQTETFKNWWKYKITEIHNENAIKYISMSVGTILEHDIISLYEKKENVKGICDKQKIKRIARANTDYILNKKIYDVKATKKAIDWYLSQKVPTNYKRQLIHYLYVFGYSKAGIIAYKVDEELKNPFIKLDKNKLFEIDVEITYEEIQRHKQIIEYLDFCKEMNIFPK